MAIPRNLGNLAPGVDTNGVLGVSKGGTGQTTTAGVFNAINPMTTTGDLIYEASPTTAARLGIGTTGQVLTVSGGIPAWVTPAAGGSTYEAVASGSLSNGSTVIINTDGTVSAISGVSATTFLNATANSIYSAYDAANNKVIIAYRDGNNGNNGTVVVGTVSGVTISFGTPVVFTAEATDQCCVVYDANAQKIVVGYNRSGDVSNVGLARVGTVSGNTVTFGAVANMPDAINTLYGVFHSGLNKVVFTYRNNNSGQSTAVVGTVSGTTISFGASATMSNRNSVMIGIAYDASTQKVVFSEVNIVNQDCYLFLGTVSGTSISFSGETQLTTGSTQGFSMTYDPGNTRVILSYGDPQTSNYNVARTLTVSGSTFSLGTKVVYESSTGAGNSIVYNSNTQTIVIVYKDSNNSNYGSVISGTVSGTSITFGSAATFEAGAAINMPNYGTVYNSTEQKVVTAYNYGGSNIGKALVLTATNGTTNLTASNFIGFSNASYTNGQTATIQIVGAVDDAQAGLTAGQAYYVTIAGGLSTTAASPAVFAGTAVSSTKIIVKG